MQKLFLHVLFSELLLFSFLNLEIKIFAQSDPVKSLPETIDGWKISEQDRFFDDNTLYDYIDGGAELFISYGFTKVFNRNYSKPEQSNISVDIFYMNSSSDAFGVFMQSTGRIENDFGQQSQQTIGSIIFWKDNFYISIMCNPETEESKIAISKLAKEIDKSITGIGSLPPIISLLPENNLDNKSIRYFKHYIWLNSHTFISNENILNINSKVNCVQAKYNIKNSNPILLLIEYPTIEEAALARNSFIHTFNSKLLKSKILKTEKHKWIGLDSFNNHIWAVFNCNDKTTAQNLLDSASKQIK
ncbi:MAG: hypothetical protein NTX22_11910 [Ignavibacteriales bacterium]|nr:hypothetical protein [Ignavibacteriales bacterium]